MSETKQTIKKHLKSRLPNDIITDLRIVYRIVMEAMSGLKRAGIVNIAIISTMAAILAIFGALFRTSLSVATFAEAIGGSLELSVYVDPNYNSENLMDKISKIDHVDETNIVTKEASWAKMKKEMDMPNIDNPLPDTIHVKTDSPGNISEVYERIKNMEGVEDVNYAKDLAQKMEIFYNVVNTITIIVVIVIAILTVTIINNTIQLVIQSRKDEIEIMRLMGVSNWYIRTPLFLQGAIYGFLGAFLALIPMGFIQLGLAKVHHFFMVPFPPYADKIVDLSIFILAVLFASSGSLLSIKKHIQV